MKNHWLFFLLISLLVLSCNKDEEGRVEQGYRPVYIDKSTALAVSSESAQAIENPGKIYIYGNMILLNERYKGIHVIDNSNPKSPSVVSFIRIYGNRDMAVKANVLYADNITDLVAINISDPLHPTELSRIHGVYDYKHQMYPEAGGWFECVDTTRGLVVDWEPASLTNPKCFRE